MTTNALQIIALAKDIREYYNSTNAIEVATRLGYRIVSSKINPIFKGNIISTTNYPTLIMINSNYCELSQNIIAAHELGHALLHNEPYNQFNTSADPKKQQQEYEANLFAVAFLFNSSDFSIPIECMNSAQLKALLDANIY